MRAQDRQDGRGFEAAEAKLPAGKEISDASGMPEALGQPGDDGAGGAGVLGGIVVGKRGAAEVLHDGRKLVVGHRDNTLP